LGSEASETNLEIRTEMSGGFVERQLLQQGDGGRHALVSLAAGRTGLQVRAQVALFGRA
jgi:hypothetical protein